MTDYGAYSFWLETCGDDLTPRPHLDGSIDVDVAILGAGYSGLWTAYYLLQRRPSLKIALLEREIAGFGASGRNGGWCTVGFPLSYGIVAETYGADRARALEAAMRDAVDEVGRVCAREGIDAHYARGGALHIARGRHEIPLIEQEYAGYAALGMEDGYALLDPAQVEARIRVTDNCGALFVEHCAALHPGRLVRGLARTVERMGATIYEQTEVSDFRAGANPELLTPRGEARAGTIVLAGESYLSRLPALHRQITPIYSLIVLTEPLSSDLWQQIGWEQRECVSSNRYVVDYLQRTADGRVLFGSRGEPYHFGSKIDDRFDRHGPTHAMIQGLVHEWFPMLRDVRFTHSWGGPVGMPRDFMPTVNYDASQGLATARGYTGQGVATTNLAGRTLAELILGEDTPRRDLPFVGHRSPDWEMEPLRWLGMRYMQWAYARIDARAARTGQAPTGRSMAERLGRH